MAKRRKSRIKTVYRRAKSSFKRRRSRGSGKVTLFHPYELGYGVARPIVTSNSLFNSLASKLPFGNYNDEAIMATAGFLAGKFGGKMGKNVGNAILKAENYRVGEFVGQGLLAGGMNTTSVNSSIYNV